MCGIAGIVSAEGSRETTATAVRRMISTQRHRGPDGEGFYDDQGVSLGHCRLAVLDLSATGHQPMSDKSGRYWITYNGEIYNYRELARQLQVGGYCFKGASDTEVLLAAFHQWGVDCLHRLRGMFAFAIWDRETSTLFAARDRFGIKPFHYWSDGTRQLAFASELKALLEFLPRRSANLRLAGEFLAWNLVDHEQEETMVAGIRRLAPAHALLWHTGEPLRMWRYWEYKVGDELEVSRKREQELISEFRIKFEETVSLHLRSDVPVGTCLSGGLDSSAIACVTHAELRRRGEWRDGGQHTFSACFKEPHLDERAYIQSVVSTIRCQPHMTYPSGEGLVEDLDALLWHQEEPIGGTGVYAQYCVARLAKQSGIKVLLDGQGADEQLAGYRKFMLVYLKQLLKSKRYVKTVGEAARFLLNREVMRTSRFVDARRYLFDSLPELSSLWPDGQMPVRPSLIRIGDSLASRIESDMTRFSLPPLLRFEDRNMMAFGVESRVPFVDHELAEWVARLPLTLRLSGGWTKLIMREALKGILPEAVRTRRSKLGFSTPESSWLAGPLAGWLRDTLCTSRHLNEVVSDKAVRQLLARRTAGDRSLCLENLLFRLAVYEAWARKFLESGTAESDKPNTISAVGKRTYQELNYSRKVGRKGRTALPRVMMLSNHQSAQQWSPSAGIFIDRQIYSLEKLGAQILRYDLGPGHSLFQLAAKYFDLKRIVRDEQPDLIHAQYGTIVSMVGALLGRPLVISFCGNDLLSGASVSRARMYLGFLLSNLAALRAHRIICKSSELREALWWRKARAVVIPNGVDLDMFTPGSYEKARRELGWDSLTPVVLFNVGSDPRRKGLSVAEAALAIVRKTLPDASLFIVSKVQPSVMPVYYRAADVLLCASLCEGSPNVVKEALACNLPVITTDVGDVRERLVGVHPSAVVDSDASAIADALVAILVKRERSNGREKIGSLGLPQVADRVLDVYREALRSDSRGPLTMDMPVDDGIAVTQITEGPILDGVVQLHHEAFSGYLNTLLGAGYVKSFMRWFIKREDSVSLAAVDRNQAVVGYVIGAGIGYDKALNRDLFWTVAVRILLKPWLLLNPLLRIAIKARLRVMAKHERAIGLEQGLPQPSMSLIAIGVASSRRRNGIGLQLMQAFTEQASVLQMRSLRLSVYQDGVSARRFYEKCGWKLLEGETREGGVLQYAKILKPNVAQSVSHAVETSMTVPS